MTFKLKLFIRFKNRLQTYLFINKNKKDKNTYKHKKRKSVKKEM